jgi:hypothetical protein
MISLQIEEGWSSGEMGVVFIFLGIRVLTQQVVVCT